MNDKPIYTPTMWRDDLLSGEFKRGTELLVNGDSMCCLGVGSFQCGVDRTDMHGSELPDPGWFPVWDLILADDLGLDREKHLNPEEICTTANDSDEQVEGRWQTAGENPDGVVAYIENHLIGRCPAGMFAEVAS